MRSRTTAILAIGFFATSLLLGIMARYGERPTDILNRIPATTGSQSAPAGGSTNGGGILDQLGGEPSGSGNGAAPAAPGCAGPARCRTAAGSGSPGKSGSQLAIKIWERAGKEHGKLIIGKPAIMAGFLLLSIERQSVA